MENKNNKLVPIVSTNDMVYKNYETKKISHYVLVSTSTAILLNNYFLQYIQDLLEIYGDNELNYCRYDFQLEKCILQVGENFDVIKNQMSKILSKKIQNKDYIVEIMTEENKKYRYKLDDFINNVYPIVDLISVKE